MSPAPCGRHQDLLSGKTVKVNDCRGTQDHSAGFLGPALQGISINAIGMDSTTSRRHDDVVLAVPVDVAKYRGCANWG